MNELTPKVVRQRWCQLLRKHPEWQVVGWGCRPGERCVMSLLAHDVLGIRLGDIDYATCMEKAELTEIQAETLFFHNDAPNFHHLKKKTFPELADLIEEWFPEDKVA